MSNTALQDDLLTWIQRCLCCSGYRPKRKPWNPINRNRTRSVQKDNTRVTFSKKVNKVEPLIFDQTGVVKQRSYISLLSSSSDEDSVPEEMRMFVEKYVAQTIHKAAIRLKEEKEKSERVKRDRKIPNGVIPTAIRPNGGQARPNERKLRNIVRQFSMIREVTEYPEEEEPEGLKPEMRNARNGESFGDGDEISLDNENVKNSEQSFSESDADSNFSPMESDSTKYSLSSYGNHSDESEDDSPSERNSSDRTRAKVRKPQKRKLKQTKRKISTSSKSFPKKNQGSPHIIQGCAKVTPQVALGGTKATKTQKASNRTVVGKTRRNSKHE